MSGSYILLDEKRFIYHKKNKQVLSIENTLRELEKSFGMKEIGLCSFVRYEVVRESADAKIV